MSSFDPQLDIVHTVAETLYALQSPQVALQLCSRAFASKHPSDQKY